MTRMNGVGLGANCVPRMVRSPALSVAVALCVMLAAAPAGAAGPAALVEDVAGPVTSVGVFDYLDAGTTVTLPPGARIVIGYLQSCVRETVRGGTITIGETQSTITGAESVERSRIECDSKGLRLTVQQAGKAGVMVFRAPTTPKRQQARVKPDLVVYGLSPLVDTGGERRLAIERLDRANEKITIEADPAAKTRMFDLARRKLELAPGGTYRLVSGDREIVIRIHPFAAGGEGPATGRLVRF